MRRGRQNTMAFQAPLCQTSSNFLIKNGNQQLKVKDTFRGHAADVRVCREYTAGTLTRPEGHYRPQSGRDSLCSDPPPSDHGCHSLCAVQHPQESGGALPACVCSYSCVLTPLGALMRP